MKNAARKIKLPVVAALTCACAVAWAENVLYIHPEDYVSGKGAEAFGTKDYAFEDTISTSVTVAIWAKDLSATYGKFIAGVYGRWYLAIPHTSSYTNGNKRLTFRTESGYTMADEYVLDDSNWHFVVGTFNYDAENDANSFQRLYVDGSLTAELTDGITAITTPDKMFTLGGAASDMSTPGSIGWTDGFSGHFAELSVWNRALSTDEVSALYSQTTRLVGDENGLVAYWPLTGAPGMAAAEYKFPNLAATSGVPNFTARVGSTRRVDIEDDEDFTKPFVRCVASPEWCAEHSYVQEENATGRSWSDPFTNLAVVAAAAVSHERILCSPGTHKIESSISPLVTYFYLGSYDSATSAPCPETAIIDAQEKCRHFISSSSATGESNFTVENLTFVNGRESDGGSMYFRSNIGKINNCIFHDNAATNGSGGAYCAVIANGTVVSNCQFYGNSATNGGGAAYLIQNAESVSDYQRFVDCVFSNNTVTGSGAGAGVYVNRKIELENSVFSDNKCAGGGNGGHACVGANSILTGCEFTGTCQGGNGTCLRIESGSWSVTNCVFRNMTCSGSSSRFIDLHGAGSAIVDCVFTNNANVTTLFYQNCQNLLFRQCLIADNASDKAVVPNVVGSAVFENCTIPQAVVTPATMSAATTNTFVNCILPNATVASSGSYCNILSNCLVKTLQDGPYDSGVITGKPKFKDAENGDYTLEVNSPCRERALALDWMTSGSTDLLGNSRVVDSYGKAFTAEALPDLGCYEVQERKTSGLMLIVR